MQVNWVRGFNNSWYSLNSIYLDNPRLDYLRGIYVIWHDAVKPRYLVVGQGIIRDKLKEHKKNTAIQTYAVYGLYATWAVVNKDELDGVENYLFSRLNPAFGTRCPDCKPITVNLPHEL
jgi:hypothetical protein